MTAFDAVIVGGSLAGSTTALLLAREGMKVLVLEKSEFPRDKVCGEFLSPAAWPLLAALGVRDRVARLAGKKIRTFSISFPGGRELRGSLPVWLASHPYGLGVSRSALDSALLQAVRHGGVLVMENHEVRSIEREPSAAREAQSFIVTARRGTQREAEYRASLVVNAAGTLNWLSRIGGAAPCLAERIGFKAHFGGLRTGSHVRLFFFTGGYVGAVEVEGDRTAVCGAVDGPYVKRVDGNFDLLLQCASRENPALELLLKDGQRAQPWVSCGMPPVGMRCAYEAGVFNVADAASFLEPLLGGGMTLAFSSSFLLAAFLARGAQCAPKRDQIGRAYARALSHFVRAKLAAGALLKRLARLPDSCDWMRRAVFSRSALQQRILRAAWSVGALD